MAHLQTPEGVRNLNTLITNLEVDSIKVNPRPSTLKKIRRLGLIKIGNPNYAEHYIVFSAVARVALYNVPLVVWGEDIGTEFGGNISKNSERDGSAEGLINNDLFRESSFDELISGYIKQNELFFWSYPDEKTIRKNICSIYLSHFYP